MTLTPINSGWIEVICGPMFSGKTEELIRRLIRAQIAKQKVAIFKPNSDNRYEEDYIVSHNQRKIKSIQIKNTDIIMSYCKKADVFGIDEAQFFDISIVDVCRTLANGGKRVVVAGLEKDYLAQGFGPMPELLVLLHGLQVGTEFRSREVALFHSHHSQPQVSALWVGGRSSIMPCCVLPSCAHECPGAASADGCCPV